MFEVASIVGPLVIASLIVLSPFTLIPLLLGYVVGRRVEAPVGAGAASGLVGVTLFWSSLIIVFAMILVANVGKGYVGMAFILSVVFVVAIAVSPMFLALAVFTWWRAQRRAGLR